MKAKSFSDPLSIFLSIIYLSTLSVVFAKTIKKIPFSLGNTSISAKITENGSGLTFFNMHDNENTCVKAAIQYINEKGGKVIELQAQGKRNITFNYNNVDYKFDPNRIFTQDGIKKTLKSKGPYSEQAKQILMTFGNNLLDKANLKEEKVIIAIHNNTNNNYSITDYLTKYANDAADIHINKNMDPDDFFYVNSKTIFDGLKKRNQNVILQNNKTVNDDGSLSVLCGKKLGVEYVNIEAQHGHYEEQRKMIHTLEQVLPKNCK